MCLCIKTILATGALAALQRMSCEVHGWKAAREGARQDFTARVEMTSLRSAEAG